MRENQTFKMESFYKNWLNNNKSENEAILQSLNSNESREQPQVNVVTEPEINNESNFNGDLRNNIIYQNSEMQLYLEKGNLQRQIRFKLQDHLFYMKIKLIDSNREPPMLRDILNFLEEAFQHILSEIRRYYKPEDHNIAFLTLYQQPMISGLNTGKKNFNRIRIVFNIYICVIFIIYSFQVDSIFRKHLQKWFNVF
jgi:hypothetical protein